jgi:hypothetical protein
MPVSRRSRVATANFPANAAKNSTICARLAGAAPQCFGRFFRPTYGLPIQRQTPRQPPDIGEHEKVAWRPDLAV